MPFNKPDVPDISQWLTRKYDILGQQASGEYQRNIAEAGRAGAEAGVVGANAASRQALEAAQAQLLRAQAGIEFGRTGYAGGGASDLAARILELHNPGLGESAEARQKRLQQQPQQQQNPPAQDQRPSWLPPEQLIPLPRSDPRRSLLPRDNPLMQRINPPQDQDRSVWPALPSPLERPPSNPNQLDPNQPVLPIPGNRTELPTQNLAMLRKGTANVKAPLGKGKAKGKGGGMPKGLEAILPALMAASQSSQMGGGALGPQAASGAPPPPPMAAGAAAPPGFARGTGMVPAPSAHPRSGYPFGAGYLFGATQVPGQGSGTVDKVPAMLAPHEAVLNRAAADTLGRGRIAALNAKGAKQMGLRRGAPR